MKGCLGDPNLNKNKRESITNEQDTIKRGDK